MYAIPAHPARTNHVLPPRTLFRHHAAMRIRTLEHALALARRLRRPTATLVKDVSATCARGQRRLRPQDVTRKGVGDFVTSMDVRCEGLLRRGLLGLVPDVGFLGEESLPTDLEHDLVWVVDPIDGTSNFAHQLPHYAVSAALLWKRRPILGVVHCQPENALYTAIHRDGARRNGRRVLQPGARSDDEAIFGCQWFRGQASLDFLRALQQDGARIRTYGSTVVQLCDAATGRLDDNVQQQGRLWDFAAAGLVAEEAGLRFTDWEGRRVFPLPSLDIGHTATIAARPARHRRLVAALKPLA